MKFFFKPRIQTFYQSLSFDNKFSFWTIVTTFLGLIFSTALSMLVVDNSVSVQSKLSKIEYVDKILPSYIRTTQLYGSTFYDLEEISKQESEQIKAEKMIQYYSKNKDVIVKSAEYLVDSVSMSYCYYTTDSKIADEIRANNGCILILTKVIKLCNDSIKYSQVQVNDSIASLMKSSRYLISSLYNTNVAKIANTAGQYYNAFINNNNPSVNIIPITYLMEYCVKNWLLISKDILVSGNGLALNYRTIWYLLIILIIAFLVCNLLIRLIISPYRTINNKEFYNLQEKYNRMKNENRNLATSIENLEHKISELESLHLK